MTDALVYVTGCGSWQGVLGTGGGTISVWVVGLAWDFVDGIWLECLRRGSTASWKNLGVELWGSVVADKLAWLMLENV